MNAEKDKAPERLKRVWITWDDAYPWPTPEMGGDEYVHVDLLATARKEAALDFVTDLLAVTDAADVQKLTSLITRARDRRAATTDTDITERG